MVARIISAAFGSMIPVIVFSFPVGMAAVMCRLATIHAYTLIEVVPIALYLTLFAVAFLPWPMPYPSSRMFFLQTCQRVALPLQV